MGDPLLFIRVLIHSLTCTVSPNACTHAHICKHRGVLSYPLVYMCVCVCVSYQPFSHQSCGWLNISSDFSFKADLADLTGKSITRPVPATIVVLSILRPARVQEQRVAHDLLTM